MYDRVAPIVPVTCRVIRLQLYRMVRTELACLAQKHGTSSQEAALALIARAAATIPQGKPLDRQPLR
ncbi:MAG: hypothetical protein AAGF94_16085 [Pseudomonadota bacterium]